MAKLTPEQIKARLEYIRGEIRAERVSYDELHELQSLAQHIEPGDVELLEPAGVPEGADPTGANTNGPQDYDRYLDEVRGIFYRVTGNSLTRFFEDAEDFRPYFNCGYLPQTALYEAVQRHSAIEIPGLLLDKPVGTTLASLFSAVTKG